MHQAANQDLEKLKSDRVIIDQRLEVGIQVLAAAGAVSLVYPATVIQAAGAIALTLANGYPGQIKIIWMQTATGAATLTPTNLYNANSITFTEVNDSWWGIFFAGEWHTIGGTAAVTVLA
jgi:hypothetical protein